MTRNPLNMNNQLQTLHDVLKDWPLWPILNQYEQTACDFIPLEQGLTNENWLVTLPNENNQQFVIRINAKNAKTLNIHHQNEYEIVERISKLGICPAISYNDPDFKYWVRPYISGYTLAEHQSAGFEISEDLEQVAKLLLSTHKQPIEKHWPSVNTYVRTEFFWAQTLPKPSMQNANLQQLKQELDTALLPNNHLVCLCHMDTNTHNWIKNKNGTLNLIDWEYAGLGDPIWDLAVFSDSAKLSLSEEKKLLSFYGDYTVDQLHLAKLQMEYLSILWFAVQENTDSNTLYCELKNLAARASINTD